MALGVFVTSAAAASITFIVTNPSGQTGALQPWDVPEAGDYRITALGASGGTGGGAQDSGLGGRGASAEGIFTLAEGDRLNILVGASGEAGTGARGGGGGGGSFVFFLDGATSTLLVAAGGGGGGGFSGGGGGGAVSQNENIWDGGGGGGSFVNSLFGGFIPSSVVLALRTEEVDRFGYQGLVRIEFLGRGGGQVAVPAPGGLAVLAVALLGLAALRRRA